MLVGLSRFYKFRNNWRLPRTCVHRGAPHKRVRTPLLCHFLVAILDGGVKAAFKFNISYSCSRKSGVTAFLQKMAVPGLRDALKQLALEKKKIRPT